MRDLPRVYFTERILRHEKVAETWRIVYSSS